MSDKLNTRLGYSLIELTIVILILGILAAVAVPRFQDSWSKHALDVACHRVAADLEMAKSFAITTSSSTSVEFHSSTDSDYQMPKVPAPFGGTGVYSVNLEESPYRSKIHSAAFNGSEVATFNGFGVPDSAGQVVLNSGKYFQVVSVSTKGIIQIQQFTVGIIPEDDLDG